MGEAFISSKKERFEHQRDAAYEEQLNSENLFSGVPDVVTTVYRCVQTADNVPLEAGDRVLIADLREKNLVVLYNNSVVGCVEPRDGSKLRAVLGDSPRKMLVAVIHSAPTFNRVFTVSIDVPRN